MQVFAKKGFLFESRVVIYNYRYALPFYCIMNLKQKFPTYEKTKLHGTMQSFHLLKIDKSFEFNRLKTITKNCFIDQRKVKAERFDPEEDSLFIMQAIILTECNYTYQNYSRGLVKVPAQSLDEN